MENIGIIGAGQMGSGIAQLCAQAGIKVAMADVSDDVLGASLAGIEKALARLVARERITRQDADAALGHISTSTDYRIFSDCDLVIEAAAEDEDIKCRILAKLVPALAPAALIASNTSSISITRLAAATDRPERFIGMHFMNPVPVMELVELIRGIATNDATYEAIHGLAIRLGKTPVTAEDSPAFMINRILLPMINEAVFALHEGIGSVADIDQALKLGARHPMGPLELADFVGLDTCLSVMRVLHDGFADSKYRPCPLLVKYVEAGWLGRKSGRGFYDYSGDEPVPTR